MDFYQNLRKVSTSPRKSFSGEITNVWTLWRKFQLPTWFMLVFPAFPLYFQIIMKFKLCQCTEVSELVLRTKRKLSRRSLMTCVINFSFDIGKFWFFWRSHFYQRSSWMFLNNDFLKTQESSYFVKYSVFSLQTCYLTFFKGVLSRELSRKTIWNVLLDQNKLWSSKFWNAKSSSGYRKEMGYWTKNVQTWLISPENRFSEPLGTSYNFWLKFIMLNFWSLKSSSLK